MPWSSLESAPGSTAFSIATTLARVFARAETDQDLIAFRQRLVVQPENAGTYSPRVPGLADVRNDIAASMKSWRST